MSQTISIDGIEALTELKETFEDLVKKYPDKAEELLLKDARELRKDVVRETKQVTKTTGSSKRSLGKLSSYKISKVQGLVSNQYVEISAKSPHFHLVEHGHVLKSPSGETKGFVQGKRMMHNTVKKYEEVIPQTVSKMVDELLKEEGLI